MGGPAHPCVALQRHCLQSKQKRLGSELRFRLLGGDSGVCVKACSSFLCRRRNGEEQQGVWRLPAASLQPSFCATALFSSSNSSSTASLASSSPKLGLTDWAIPQATRLKYRQQFNTLDKLMSGYLSGRSREPHTRVGTSRRRACPTRKRENHSAL